jgi:hypothetical protein
MHVTPTTYVYGDHASPYGDGYADPYGTPGMVYAGDGYADDYGDAPEDPPSPFVAGAYEGMIEAGLLVAFALVGASFDAQIEDRTGARGFGAIAGAGVGAAVSAGLARGSSAGWSSGLGAAAGALAPLVPVAVAVGMGREAGTKTTRNVLLGSSALILALGYLGRRGGK